MKLKQDKQTVQIKSDRQCNFDSLLFNSNDTTCSIFENLEYRGEFNGDLFSCGCMYCVSNINSIYHADVAAGLLNKWLKLKRTNRTDHNDNVAKIWQPFVKARSNLFMDTLYLFQEIKQIGFKQIINVR